MEDKTITVSAPVQYRRWQAPNFATMAVAPGKRQDGFREAPSTPVAELAPEVLNVLAQAWLDDLYGKVGRPPPSLAPAPPPDNWERFSDGRLKPFLPPSEYDSLRADDRFLYNRAPKPESLV